MITNVGAYSELQHQLEHQLQHLHSYKASLAIQCLWVTKTVAHPKSTYQNKYKICSLKKISYFSLKSGCFPLNLKSNNRLCTLRVQKCWCGALCWWQCRPLAFLVQQVQTFSGAEKSTRSCNHGGEGFILWTKHGYELPLPLRVTHGIF